MESIRAIIVDDEKPARRVLRNLLAITCPNVEVIAECISVEHAVEQIKLLKPLLVFLDVQMPNYAGYEIVEFFNEINFEIIFVTAYDQQAVKAFDICAIDYLVKPISRERLLNSIRKLEAKISKQDQLKQYQTLLQSMKEKQFKKIVIPELGERHILNVSDIIAIEADGAYSKIYLSEMKPLVTSKNLKYFEDKFSEIESFFRSHRGWIISTCYLEFFNKTESTLSLKHDIKARISRNRYDDFLSLISHENDR